MSVYFVEKKGWRYDFTKKGQRYTDQWMKTKTEAKQAESKRREAIKNPRQDQIPPKDSQTIETGMDFLELVNRRLDFLKDYKSEKYYKDGLYQARRWVKEWGKIRCDDISEDMVHKFLRTRKKVSHETANAEIRALRATFNYGKRKKWITASPLDDVQFFPVEKKEKYVPSQADIDKVISEAIPEMQDYLWTIRETFARVGEINRMVWDDVNFENKYVVLYTRKKRGGHLTPRRVPMTEKLYEVLSQKFANHDQSKPWVFWHRYWSQKNGEFIEGPYQDRKKIMKELCKKAGVRYFRYHPIRHSGASVMDNNNVPIGVTQRLLGHEQRTTTEIYLHSLGNDACDAMGVYEKARKNSHTNSHTD
jgi:integrase